MRSNSPISNTAVPGASSWSIHDSTGTGIYINTVYLNDKDADTIGISASEDKRVYLECRSRRDDFDFDVIFVHALGTNRFDTWRCGTAFWPDYLLDDFPGARVLLFNYDTQMWTGPGVNAIQSTANDLQNVLRKARGRGDSHKPIVWVTHSLGGFLVKVVCMRSTNVYRETENNFGEVPHTIDRTEGAIFIGTPHRSMSMNGWQPTLERIYWVAKEHFDCFEVPDDFGTAEIKGLLDFLSNFESDLDKTNMRIYSFYEEHETCTDNFPLLVTSFYNGLYHPRETRDALPGNYITMSQFQHRLHPGYLKIRSSIETIMNGSRDIDIPVSVLSLPLPPSGLERKTMDIAKDFLSPKTLKEPNCRNGNGTLLSPSIFWQYAPTMKLRRLKRLLAFPRISVPSYPHMRSQDNHIYPELTLTNTKLRDWLHSRSLLAICGPGMSGKSTLSNHIIRLLGAHQKGDSHLLRPQRCVMSYYFGSSLALEHSIAQMLKQFLLQLLETIPELVRHFLNRHVFTRIQPNWPEWDTENQPKEYQSENENQREPDFNPRESYGGTSLNLKDFVVSPFTTMELVETFISTLHDDQIGEAFLVIDGLEHSLESVKSQFQHFISLLQSLKMEKLKICLTYQTTEIRSLNPIIYLRTPFDKRYLVKKHQGPDSTVALAHQVPQDLSSPEYIKTCLNNLQWGNLDLSQAEPDVGRLDSLYHRTFDYVERSVSSRHIALLFLVAMSACPLTPTECDALAPPGENLASWYEGRLLHSDSTAPSLLIHQDGNTSYASEISTCEGRKFLEEKLFGLIKVQNGTLSIFHPTFKEFLLRSLGDGNLWFHLEYNIGLSCLEFLRGIGENVDSMKIMEFSYPLRYWSKHLSAAHSSAKWKREHSEKTISVLTGLWGNTRIMSSIRDFSPASLPPIHDLPLPCFLASNDLSKVLDVLYDGDCIPNHKDEFLSLEQRCAAVNRGQKTLDVLREHGHVESLNDRRGRNLQSYVNWTRAREFAEQCFLPSWTFEFLESPATNKTDWGTIRKIIVEESSKLRPGPREEDSYPRLAPETKDLLGRMLVLATRRCDNELVSTLLQNGADCNYIDEKDPQLPFVLHIAASMGNREIAEQLRDHGSRYSTTNVSGMQPIHCAAERGHREIVKLLIAPLVDQEKRLGQTPLFMLCAGFSSPTVSALIHCGAGFGVNVSDKQGRTPMHVASATGATSMVHLMLRKGANPEVQDNEGVTPLHLAAFGGWAGVVDALLAVGVSTDIETDTKQTPLHFACKSTNPTLDVILILLRQQSNPYIFDANGLTPLHIAVANSSVAVVELLLKFTPTTSRVEEFMALAKNNQEITRILERHYNSWSRPLNMPAIEDSKIVPEYLSRVNVVFVHGFFESASKTWSNKSSSSVLWPAKYLVTSTFNARVFFWDHQLELTDFSNSASVQKLGISLLRFISDIVSPDYRSESDTNKPLVLIGHSLGGLVIKTAITTAVERENRLLDHLRGVVFLGTPHKGREPDSLEDDICNLVQTAVDNRLELWRYSSFLRPVMRRSAQSKRDDSYRKVDTEFIETCHRRHIQVLSIIEDFSKLMSWDYAFYTSSFTRNVTVHRDHENLGRFSSIEDVVYQEMVAFLGEVVTGNAQPKGEIEDITDPRHIPEEVSIAPPSQLLQRMSLEDDILATLKSDSGELSHPNDPTIPTSSLLEPLNDKSKPDTMLSEWVKSPKPPRMWITGKPGSGKTTVMLQLYQYLKETLRNQRSSDIVACFFFKYSKQQNTAHDMLRSILYQIFLSRGDLVKSIFQVGNKDYAPVSKSLTRWDTLVSIFHKVVETASNTRFYIIIDALDECDHRKHSSVTDNSFSSSLCWFITHSSSLRNLKICFSSRERLEFVQKFQKFPQLSMHHENKQDIVKYVKQQLAKTSYSNGQTSKRLEEEVISRSGGVILWATLMVNILVKSLDNGDSDEELNRTMESTPQDLRYLYSKMIQDIPRSHKKEATRILRIVTTVTFPLDIDLLILAIENFQVTTDSGRLTKVLRSDLHAINVEVGEGNPNTETETEIEQKKQRAIGRIESRCPGLLDYSKDTDIQLIHQSARDFLIQSGHNMGLLGDSEDGDFSPSVNLFSASIIRLKRDIVNRCRNETTCQNENITKLVSQAFACASLADTEANFGEVYVRLFDELAHVCLYIQHLYRPHRVDSLPSDSEPNSLNYVTCRHYGSLLAIRASLWGYLLHTIDEWIVTLRDHDQTSLLMHLINPRSLDTLPWSEVIQCSRDLPDPSVVESFLSHGANPNDSSLDRSVWREVLEAGYHCFAAHEVPKSSGPPQTYDNCRKWVNIMQLFLKNGADVNASFPSVKFEARKDMQIPGQSESPILKTLDPVNTLLDVMRSQRLYHAEFQDILNDVYAQKRQQVESSPVGDQAAKDGLGNRPKFATPARIASAISRSLRRKKKIPSGGDTT